MSNPPTSKMPNKRAKKIIQQTQEPDPEPQI
jgi:hypothetical protein